MPEQMPFLSLPDGWEPTRATLHSYAHALGAVARTAIPPHPKWWHLSLSVSADGLSTDPIPLEGHDTSGRIRLDLQRHAAVVTRGDDEVAELPLDAGLTESDFAARLFSTVTDSLAIADQFDRSRVADDSTRHYDPDHAEAFSRAVARVAAALSDHRASLPGDVGPVQLWPHGFDLSFEWFGTLQVEHSEDGETSLLPSQLNHGWYPRGDAYFYSNPWPFDESLLSVGLPHGAAWHTEGWQGSMLDYASLIGDPDGPTKLSEYATAVFTAARPTLSA